MLTPSLFPLLTRGGRAGRRCQAPASPPVPTPAGAGLAYRVAQVTDAAELALGHRQRAEAAGCGQADVRPLAGRVVTVHGHLVKRRFRPRCAPGPYLGPVALD